ncbi:MAG: hypothetical protein E6Q66_02980 [Pedobacter sp.]|nr:MAG: hypothetical protein E6Q66_02980 [Pedobacter sp.]
MGTLLIHRKLKQQRVLLLHTNSIEFITSFLACQYAGAIAVPLFPQSEKRHTEQLIHIIKDADPAPIITERSKVNEISMLIIKQPILILDNSTSELQIRDFLSPVITLEDDISFIQYTSVG